LLLMDERDGADLADASNRAQQLDVAALLEPALQPGIGVEMVLDGAASAGDDDDDLLDPRRHRLLDRVLDDGPVDQRHHFLGDRLGGRQEASAEPCGGQDGLTDTHDERRSPWVVGPTIRPPEPSSGAHARLRWTSSRATEYSNSPPRFRDRPRSPEAHGGPGQARPAPHRMGQRYNRLPMLKSFVRTLRGPSRDPRMAGCPRPRRDGSRRLRPRSCESPFERRLPMMPRRTTVDGSPEHPA